MLIPTGGLVWHGTSRRAPARSLCAPTPPAVFRRGITLAVRYGMRRLPAPRLGASRALRSYPVACVAHAAGGTTARTERVLAVPLGRTSLLQANTALMCGAPHECIRVANAA